jgi:hypothetical protein
MTNLALKSVRYNRVLVVTEFIITKFHYIMSHFSTPYLLFEFLGKKAFYRLACFIKKRLKEKLRIQFVVTIKYTTLYATRGHVHQHFYEGICTNILAPKKFKPKMLVQKSLSQNFHT